MENLKFQYIILKYLDIAEKIKFIDKDLAIKLIALTKILSEELISFKKITEKKNI